jgi:hypothetical protein
MVAGPDEFAIKGGSGFQMTTRGGELEAGRSAAP